MSGVWLSRRRIRARAASRTVVGAGAALDGGGIAGGGAQRVLGFYRPDRGSSVSIQPSRPSKARIHARQTKETSAPARVEGGKGGQQRKRETHGLLFVCPGGPQGRAAQQRGERNLPMSQHQQNTKRRKESTWHLSQRRTGSNSRWRWRGARCGCVLWRHRKLPPVGNKSEA